MLCDSITIPAEVERIWPFVANPVGMATWNAKIVEVDRASDQLVHRGETFEIVFRMSGRDTNTRVEVMVCQPLMEVVYRHHYQWKSRQRYAEESYRLELVKGGVQVTQLVNLAGAGIPWIFRGLGWLLSRVGKSKGKSNMERLRDAVLTNERLE